MNEIKWSNGNKPIRSSKNDKLLYDNEEKSNTLNKREEVNDKINQRELIQNTCKNPFFDSEDYIQHLSNQHDYLMPQKTN
tara:strand:+ start:1874 stop:2113 length:240 start_codon:yes stop_codon:yes gene_type:complete